MSATSAPTTLPANRTALPTSTWWADVSEPHPKPPGIITHDQIRMLHHTQQCSETACLTLRLSASADLWSHTSPVRRSNPTRSELLQGKWWTAHMSRVAATTHAATPSVKYTSNREHATLPPTLSSWPSQKQSRPVSLVSVVLPVTAAGLVK